MSPYLELTEFAETVNKLAIKSMTMDLKFVASCPGLG
jgi:hypothetical protein